ncbi:hypothetical protein GS597_04215 [Synechococcales cyanobacterium C]|uniref:Uncharacterized protein n=1 Tax=Petrachloros mirabilis ULC683 TaxID=2781853 RepID=A0A8K1ZX60_9CYAN|nr:hypothetical protein [Petrachloros mirabilis]NCJ05727.1 hypothetical protein [Petrachloros mirabilis ULC683]
MSRWINFLALLPSTSLTLLIISIAFLRFYDETDFLILGQLTSPRLWSNRLTLAAIVVAVVNLGVEWNRRNRETDRLDRAEGQRAEDERRRRENRARAAARRAEEAERQTRRARVEIERDLALLTFLADPSEQNRQKLTQAIALLSEYRDSL